MHWMIKRPLRERAFGSAERDFLEEMDGWMEVVRCRSYGAWIQNNEHKSKCLSMVVVRKSKKPVLGVLLFLYLGLV